MPDLSQSEWLSLLQQVAQGIYERGFQDGQSDILRKFHRLWRRGGQSDNDPGAAAVRASARNLSNKAGRAPRGTVGEFITKVLTRAPGQTQRDIEIAAQEEDDISTTSVGNELRRNEGSRYVKDDQKRWFVIIRDQNLSVDRSRYPNISPDHSVDSISERSDDSMMAAFADLLRDREFPTRAREREGPAHNTQANNTGEDDLND